MNVLFCAGEAVPFAKTGGLADVAGTLPPALGKLGVDVRVAIPRYRGLPSGKKKIAERVEVAFVENEAFFNRAGLYGGGDGDYPDNCARFSFFCREVLASARRDGFRPDVVHANDWQAALLPVILKTQLAKDPFFGSAKSLLTAHNLAYQGVFGQKRFAETGLDESLFNIDGFEFYGKVNLLKGGLLFADWISTVSPTYAREIQTAEFGCGLEGVIRKRRTRLAGILNGIDPDEWNPAKDPTLAEHFSAASPAGKAACKADLQRRSDLPEDPSAPLFGIVSRLVEQKGLDLVSEIADRLLSTRAQLVLLGDGNPAYKAAFRSVARRHPKKVCVRLAFDAEDAKKIYAGLDFFLMPSSFEPCGLGQMIALRYGALPVVRHTGGLADTIVDADEGPRAGNGFAFQTRAPEALWKACERALKAYEDAPRMAALRKRAMAADFSWERSAAHYLDLYRRMQKE